MTPAGCPICKSSDVAKHLMARDYVTGEEFSVYRCARCGVGLTWPSPEEINRYYPAGYRRFTSPVGWVFRLLYRLRVRGWTRRMERPGKALEIGCGNGWMLKALHDHGWQVVGLERTEEEAEFASSMTGLKVLSGNLDEFKAEPTYDLILLFNVLEHMSDPAGVLHNCKALLKDGGTVILSVPNFSSLQARISGRHWFHLDVPRHLFHFSPGSLANAIEAEGLEVSRIKYISTVHDAYGWLQSMLNRMGFMQNRLIRTLTGNKRRDLLNPTGLLMALVSTLALLPSILLSIGSMFLHSGAILEVWAKKK